MNSSVKDQTRINLVSFVIKPFPENELLTNIIEKRRAIPVSLETKAMDISLANCSENSTDNESDTDLCADLENEAKCLEVATLVDANLMEDANFLLLRKVGFTWLSYLQ